MQEHGAKKQDDTRRLEEKPFVRAVNWLMIFIAMSKPKWESVLD